MKTLAEEQYEYVRKQLRKGYWGPITRAKEMSRTSRKVNPATGRMAWFHRCNGCKEEFIGAAIQIDHIKPVVPVTGRTSIQELAERHCCEVDGLQALCKPCHGLKTHAENIDRLENRVRGNK